MIALLAETVDKMTSFCNSTHYRLMDDKLALIHAIAEIKKAKVSLEHALRDVTRIENISTDGVNPSLFQPYVLAKDQLNRAKQSAILSQDALAATVEKIKVFETSLDFFEGLGGGKCLKRSNPPHYYVKPVEADAIETVVNSLDLPSTAAIPLKELFLQTISKKEGSILKEEALRYFKQISAESS